MYRTDSFANSGFVYCHSLVEYEYFFLEGGIIAHYNGVTGVLDIFICRANDFTCDTVLGKCFSTLVYY